MRIACVSTSTVPSSTANSIQVMKVCRALSETGAEVRLWVPGKHGSDWLELARQYGLGDERSPAFDVRWVASLPQARRYDFTMNAFQRLSAWKADLVYTWLPQEALLALWRGLPTVLEVHDMPTGKAGPWFFRQVARHRRPRRILVITEALRMRLEAQFTLPLQPPLVQIAPNGADLEQYAALPTPGEARRQLGLEEGFTAVYTGHFYAGRGMDLLKGLAHALPQVRFVWVGGREPDVREWQARLEAEGLRNVRLTGFVDNRELPRYQAAADALLMPYEYSIAGSSGGNSADICSPMKMFDYLATGRAIVSSDLPVLHEVLHPGNTLFCQPDSLPAWAAALERLASDPGLRSRLGSQARIDAQRFTWRERARRALEGLL